MEFFICLLALLFISLALVWKLDINSAAAPAVSIAGAVLLVDIFGMFGALTAGFVVFYLLAVAALLWVALSKPCLKELLKKFFGPGMVFFIAAAVFFFFMLRHIGPDFRYWDEYSFWGIAAKTMWMERSLHTMVDTSMTLSAYLPGLPTTGVLFQYFTPFFREWKVYLGYDVMMMACMSMLFAANRWKNVLSNILCAAFGLLGLYGFFHGFAGFYIYTNAYSDMSLGVVFGGVLLCWFASDRKGPQEYFTTVLMLMFLTDVKDMGLAMGLVAAGIVSMDIWLRGEYPFMKKAEKAMKVLRFLLVPLLLMGAIVLVYRGWLAHFAAVTNIAETVRPYEYSAVEVFTGKDPYFTVILGTMIDFLDELQIICFGRMDTMLFVLTAVPLVGALAALAAKQPRKALRSAVAGVLLFCGFAAYFVFHAYIYTTVFPHNYSLTSFDRYISSYVVGWLMAVMGIALSDLNALGAKSLQKAFGCAALAAYIASIFYFTPVHPDQYLLTSSKLWGYMQKWDLAAAYEQDYLQYGDLLTSDDRVYFLCQGSDGGEWFVFNYEFLPAYTVPSFGTGNFVGEIGDEPGRYDVVANKENVREYFLQQGVDYFYIMRSDDYFREEFGELFTDRLEAFYDGSTHLYKVYDDGEKMTFVPIYTREGFIYLQENQPEL